MATAPDLVLLHGDAGAHPLEQAVAAMRIGAALQQAPIAHAAGFARVIVATDDPGAFAALAGRPWCLIDADGPARAFSLHDRLASLIDRYHCEAVAVTGAGGLPLLGPDDFVEVAAALQVEGAVTNNFFSADLTGWRPAAAIHRLTGLERDNQLPRRLRDDAALASRVLPQSTRTLFDLDTPIDAAILARFREAPLAAPFGDRVLSTLERLLPVLCDPAAELVVAGRVGSQAWQYIERETACRVRLYSEERGLTAAGRAHRARSLLGALIDLEGPDAFFARMAGMGDALILDTRVIEAHRGLTPARSDRFLSDCLRWEEIADPFLQALTRAAAECAVPVLLGGHSLVAGGLMLLNDVAWREHDRRR